MPKPKILAFAGSVRKDSFNKKLIKVAADAAQKAGAQVTLIDLKDYPMPLFDQDLEAAEGLPDNVKKIKEIMVAHDGFIISAPEYNSSITPLLKNVLDWASRAGSKDETPMIAYKGKAAALLSASPGALGGLRGLVTVRSVLINNGVLVLSSQMAVSKAHEAFDENGNLKDAKQLAGVEKIAQEIVSLLGKLKN